MKFILLILLLITSTITNHSVRIYKIQDHTNIIVDCNYIFEDAIKGIEIPRAIIKQLTLVDVEYYSFDDKLHKGQILINKKAAKDLLEIFEFIKLSRFPIAKVIPTVKYNWNDDSSMNDNNTTAFNYRKVKGSKVLSAHSYGMAIDINPVQNPHIKGKLVQPLKGKYDPKVRGTILRDSKLVQEFVKRGWQWGGRWRSSKDYQHFEKKN
ncbi:MAG: M15 family metallopeptidase [Ignavibacteriales bacterium]|nr:M15 family metallopeptidase [Ignavibacteriales bacterium]